MRDGSTTHPAPRSTLPGALIAAALSLALAGPAGAETRPAWIDPPARGPDAKLSDAKLSDPKLSDPKLSDPKLSDPKMQDPKPAEGRPLEDKPASTGIASAPADAAETPRRAPAARQSRRAATARPTQPPSPTPAAPPGIARGGASDPRFPDWAARAQRLATDHLDSVSAPGDGIADAAPRLYAEQVRFHGRALSLVALIAEKRRFARRWPVRRYEAQPGATRVACAAAALCVVRTTFDFQADNPARGARSRGVGEVALEISFAGDRPVIVSETSRVLRRLGPMSAASRPQRGV